VFLNILSNAFAAVEDEGRIDINIALADQDMVAVTIGDSGGGISPENIEHIFEPFFSTKGDAGTGLGLSITYGIVENLGGRLEVKSVVGEGTVFTVFLPLARRR
jgi:signal transduction histidine kinase